jgi:ribonuclease HI
MPSLFDPPGLPFPDSDPDADPDAPPDPAGVPAKSARSRKSRSKKVRRPVEFDSAADTAPQLPMTTAFTDGGARGNPGPSGYGVHIVSPTGATLAELSQFIGIQTNNIAEYSALLAALDWALSNGVRHLRVVSDSELMVRQMQGRYQVSSPLLRPLYEEARRRARQLELFRIEHVLRGKNKRADQLANTAMDAAYPPRK